MRWAFYLFVASIPFESPDRSIPLEVTTITGAVFLLAALLQPRRCFAQIPKALWFFGAYLYMYWVSFVISGGMYLDDAVRLFVGLVQVVLIFWVAYNLMRETSVAVGALLALAAACVLLGTLTVTGAVNLDPELVNDSGRVTLLGQNANRAGLTLASGALVLLGLTYAYNRKVIRPRTLVWPLLGVIGLAMLHGGSRGSLLALTIGLWTFTIAGGTILEKLRNTVVTLVGVTLLAWAGWHTPLIRSRFEKASEMNLAGREEIFPTAGRMFLERPLAGWGPSQNKYEIAYRLPNQGHVRRDAHNLVLELLTTTGLLGAVPFLLGTGVCLWGAWRGRRSPFGSLPLALLAALLAANMSSNYIAFKLHWLLMAFGAAAGSLVATHSDRARAVPRASLAARGVRPC